MILVGNGKKMIFIFSLLIALVACTDKKGDEFIQLLNKEISHRDIYKKNKDARIEQLRDSFLMFKGRTSPESEYEMCNKLYNEYILYQFDSVYNYAMELKKIAARINTSDCLLDAKIKYCLALYNAGYYKEVLDSLPASIPASNQIASATLANYYDLSGRTYFMLANVNKIDAYASKYNEIGNNLLTKALQYTEDSLDFYILKARLSPRKYKRVYLDKAIKFVKNQNEDRVAVLYSILGKNEFVLGNEDASLKYNALAAIVDMRIVTKDALALINIANVLSREKRYLQLASEYLSIALKDVSEYGSIQRVQEVNTILPVIEAERLIIAERNRILFSILFFIVTLLLIGLIIFLVRAVQQSRILSNAKRMLQETNKELKESNMIKNEYLGHYLVENSEQTALINKMYRVIGRNVKQKNYNEIITLLTETKNKNENLHEDFDRIFIKIFPNFVVEFNNLLDESAKIVLPHPNSLTPTLRIFALIRLDITDSTTISKILDCSLNTVYNYRTRIKNKATVDKEDFEKLVKEIGN